MNDPPFPEVAPGPRVGAPSLVVLPFENLGADPAQDYFADGISDDLITDLSQISDLFVVARHSAFVYKGRSVSVERVGKELGVDYALEGSVRRAGDRVRINAQLTDTATGRSLWAERFDQELAHIFDVQDDVTGRIVAALSLELSTAERGRLGLRSTNDPEAYDLFLKGQQYYPNLVDARIYLAATYIRLGRLDDAAWEVEEILYLKPDFTLAQWGRRDPTRDVGAYERLADDLRVAGLR